MTTIINLCGRPNACCPELHVSDDKTTVHITDDYGNIVTMKIEEFKQMQSVVL